MKNKDVYIVFKVSGTIEPISFMNNEVVIFNNRYAAEGYILHCDKDPSWEPDEIATKQKVFTTTEEAVQSDEARRRIIESLKRK